MIRAHSARSATAVSVDSVSDTDILFKDIPLGDVTTSMTINGPAVPIFCMMVVGRAPGIRARSARRDAADRHLQGIHRAEGWIFPPEPHLRLIGDLMEYTG